MQSVSAGVGECVTSKVEMNGSAQEKIKVSITVVKNTLCDSLSDTD